MKDGRNQYAELVSVGKFKSNNLLETIRDPAGRFVAIRRGSHLVIMNITSREPLEMCVFKDVVRGERSFAIHPDGRHLVDRDHVNHTLRLHGPDGVAECATDTVRLSWDGADLKPGERPQWGFADEHLMFSADGAHIVLATHRKCDKQAVVLLFKTDDLSLVDTFEDLRLYSYYATYGECEFEKMPYWSESWLRPDINDPGLILGIRNSGDSCLGVFALRVVDARIESMPEPDFSQSALAVDQYCLLDLRRTSDGLVVLDRDHHFGRVAWPPTSDHRVLDHAQAAEHLRDESYEIVLPYAPGFVYELREGYGVSVTDQHILLNIDAEGDRTQCIVALSPTSLAPLGWIRRPSCRAEFGELLHLGNDLFAGVSRTQTYFWRIG